MKRTARRGSTPHIQWIIDGVSSGEHLNIQWVWKVFRRLQFLPFTVFIDLDLKVIMDPMAALTEVQTQSSLYGRVAVICL